MFYAIFFSGLTQDQLPEVLLGNCGGFFTYWASEDFTELSPVILSCVQLAEPLISSPSPFMVLHPESRRVETIKGSR